MLAISRERLLIALLAFLFMTGVARGQDEVTRSGQIWLNSDPRRRLSEQWTLDLDTGMRFVRSDPSFWQTRFQPTLEFSPKKWIELTGGVWFIYTNQFEATDLFETRPTVGIKLSREIWRGARLSNYFRAEYRIQTTFETGETISAGRLRNRIQDMIPINHRSLSEDKTWSAIVDAEWFWQRDPNVDDGFNSRRRYRAGIAWRKNSTWTFQFIYGFQRSRPTSAQPFTTADHFFNLVLIQTFK